MDEAEKYKQRLEAIAEKRRLLEEEERAKREVEDERIRLQQLKRKSLRDQWLMEGPSLSPTSLDPPRSPLWGTQAQEIEKHIDKLESQTQQLAEAEEELKDVMEDGQIHEEVVVEETQTGEEIRTESPQPDKVILANGMAEMEEDLSQAASEDVLPSLNGLSEETESKHVVDTLNNIVDDDDDGTMVIRAECIMIVDESDEIAEESPKENGSPAINALTLEETLTTVAQSTQSEETEVASVDAELPESASIAKVAEEEELEEAQWEPLAEECAAVASVPVYSETQPCVTTSSPTEDGNDDAGIGEEKIEVGAKAKGNVTVEFQEVPLSQPQDGKAPGEKEPLLTGIKAKDAPLPTPSNQDQTPDRAEQAETKTPKRKTCQCCSVM